VLWLAPSCLNLGPYLRELQKDNKVGKSNADMLLLMAEIWRENQLRLVVYPMIYKVLYIPGGAGISPSAVGQGLR